MKRILLVCLLLTVIRAGAQTALYVDSSVSASGGGTSWSAAYKTLNEALNVANAGSSSIKYEISIAKGTYYPGGIQSSTNRDSAFLISRGGVKLFGGYPTGGGTRSISNNTVVLNGEIGTAAATDNSYHVLVVAGVASSADSIVIDGLNIAGGNANGTGTKAFNGQSVSRNTGGGTCIFAAAGKLLLNNCKYSSNAAAGGSGGGLANLNSAAVITGCSFSGNTALQGGGIYSSRTSITGTGPVISSCSFTGNTVLGSATSSGGGLCDMSNNAIPSFITNSLFSGNTSTGYGGGMYANNSSSTSTSGSYLYGCTFTGNKATSIGGGVRNDAYQYSYQIDSCIFTGNKAGDLGGGMFTTCTGTLSVAPAVAYCSFSLDTAGSGGGLDLGNGRTDLNNCSFTTNSAGSGAGFFTESSWNCDFWNNIFSGNTASLRGGGMYSAYAGSGTRISGCLFSGNVAGVGGGGLCDSTSAPSVINCTFSGNSAPAGTGIYNIFSASPSITNSIIWDGAGSIGNSTSSATVTYSTVQGGYTGIGNISATPLFMNPLASTSAPSTGGDYRLYSCSPAIDAGSGTPYVGVLDLTGSPRLYGIKVDMGAYEYNGTILPAITGKSSLCVNDTGQQRNSLSGGSWHSSNPAIATINSIGLVMGISAGFDTITYTVTVGTCPVSVTKTIAINILPTVSAISGSSPVCIGTPVAFTNTTGSGVWSSNNNSVATISSTGSVSGVASGQDTIVFTVTSGAGCINSASMVVSVAAPPLAPSVTSPMTYCQSVITAPLSASGTNLSWYVAATGGTPSTTAPTPSSATSGSTGYWVSQTNTNGCEGPRAQIVVNILAAPLVPTVTSPVNYCQNATAVPLTATGTNLKWYTSATGGVSSTTAPTPLSSSATTTSYWVSQTNSAGCEGPRAQILVNVFAIPARPVATGNPGVCVGDTLFLAAATSAGSPVFSWTGPSFSSTLQNPFIANVSSANSGVYRVTVSTNGCVSQPDSVVVTVSCFDSVWAGDANYDKVVDNMDALEIALTLGSTGSARQAISIAWQPVSCRNWPAMLLANPTINRKHADCNGDGIVAYSDTLAVGANYSLSHPKAIRASAKRTAGLPDLYLDFTGIPVIAGTTISVPLRLGDATTPVPKIAGLAARLMIDGVTLLDTPSLSFTGGWLGPLANTLHFAKPIGRSRIDWAYARTDQHNTNGSGALATLSLTIPPGTGGQQMRLYFDNVRLVDSNEASITLFNIIDDTVTILQASGISNPSLISGMTVVPNPSTGLCRIYFGMSAAGNYQIEMRDMSGKLVLAYSGKGGTGMQDISLQTEALSPGVYMVILKCDGRNEAPVRWIRE